MNEHLSHNEHHNQSMSSHNDGTVAEATVQPPVASETKTRKKPTNHEAAAIKFNAMMAKQIAIASVKPLSKVEQVLSVIDMVNKALAKGIKKTVIANTLQKAGFVGVTTRNITDAVAADKANRAI